MGETSALAAIIGAIILIVTKIGSWRIMLSVVVGMVATTLTFNVIFPNLICIRFNWGRVKQYFLLHFCRN